MSDFMVIHNGVITGYILPGGAVSEDVNQTAQNAYKIAKFEAGLIARTGKLERGIMWAKAKPESLDRTGSRVSSTAKHAMWVEEGTKTITPDRGTYLTVPRNKGDASGGTLRTAWLAGGAGGERPFFLAKKIDGQEPKHIMRDALRQAMRTYR